MPGIPDKQITVGPFSSSLFLWASAVPTFLSAIFFIVAYAAVGWGYVSSTGIEGAFSRHIGLWQSCHSTLGCRYLSTTEITAAARASQTFATMSLLTIMIGVLLTIAYVCFPRLKRERNLALMLAGTHLVSFLFVLITISIFGARWRDPFNSSVYYTVISYCMALAIVAMFMELIATGLTALELLIVMRKGDSRPPPQPQHQQQPRQPQPSQQQAAAQSRPPQQAQGGIRDMRPPAADYDNPTYQDPEKRF